MMRTAATCATLLTAGVVLGGCTEDTAGQPSTTTQSPSQSVTAPPSSSTGGGGAGVPADFTNSQLCALLTSDEAQRLGASSSGEPSTNVTTSDPICRWSDNTVIVMAFAADRTASALETGKGITITRTSSGGLPGVQSDNTNDPALCQVVINLGDHSSMAFSAGVHGDAAGDYSRCTVAHQFADIVIPKIRKG